MKKIAFIFLVAALGLACDRPDAPETSLPTQGADGQDFILAKVGPQTITQAQLQQRLDRLDEADRDFASTPVGRRNFIQVLVREQLTALDAQAKDLDKSDEYLAALEDKRAQLKALYEEYAAQLLGHLWEDYQHEHGVLNVTEEEIAAYYKKYPYEMTIKQLIIEDAQTAEAVLRELKRNKNRWKELERQYSIAPQRSRGKDFSFMPGEFIPELEVIAANSPSGAVQGFIKTSQGFHIIMKTSEKRLSLKDAAARIRTILENKKWDEALTDLQTKYEVVIYD